MNTTVIQNYYAIASAGRKLRNAQTSNKEAAEFLDISQKQERGGEAAHADVIKAQLQRKQRERDLKEAGLALDKAKVALAVLIFPTLQQGYEIVDDLDQLPALGSVEEVGAQSKANSADLQAARASTWRPKRRFRWPVTPICHRWRWIFSTASTPTSLPEQLTHRLTRAAEARNRSI